MLSILALRIYIVLVSAFKVSAYAHRLDYFLLKVTNSGAAPPGKSLKADMFLVEESTEVWMESMNMRDLLTDKRY